MNRRILLIMTLFAALLCGVGKTNAQEVKRVRGNIVLPEGYDYNSFNFDKINIYTFITREYANTALEALKKHERVRHTENPRNKPYTPDEYGGFEFDVPIEGYVLVWCTDYELEAARAIISASDLKSSGTEIRIIKKGTGNGGTEEKWLDDVPITGNRIGGDMKPVIKSLEGPEGMIRSWRYRIPFHVANNYRIIAQPILYDRHDISDVDSDTIYSYGHAVFHDMEEYELTQLHRMDFDLCHDSIKYYISLQGDPSYHKQFLDTTQYSYENIPHVSVNETHDTIDIYVSDRFKGYDPDTSHPYPYGVHITIDDYNTELYSQFYKDNGERRDPLRFLKTSFNKFLPDTTLFKEELDETTIEQDEELKLNFQVGKAVLVQNDTANIVALSRMNETLELVKRDAKQEIRKVNIIGVASPEGDMQSNKKLAHNRAMFVAGRINVPNTFTKSIVAPWSVLADSLRRGGHEEVANAVMRICEKYPMKGAEDPVAFRKQEIEIRRLPEYRTLIHEEYLPKLRTVIYKYTIDKIGFLPVDTIIARYRRNNRYKFERGEFWTLFNNLQGKELEDVAKFALQATRKTEAPYIDHNDGYWAYAAAVLACCYIDRDTVDLKLLKPFLDLELDTAGKVKERKLLRDNDDAIKGTTDRIVYYLNFPDIAANQLIMALRNKSGYASSDIAALETLLDFKVAEDPAYERLMAFSRCLRGRYNGDSPEDINARNLVAKSSYHNFVVMALAMDDPAIPNDDDEWLNKAVARIDSLEESLVTDYLKAVINVRKYPVLRGDEQSTALDEAKQLITNCCVNDLKFLLIASNDADLIAADDKKTKIFGACLTMWQTQMETAKHGENHPFYWFKKAIDAVKAKEPDETAIMENLYKCFALDNRYIMVLNVYMRDYSSLKNDKKKLKLLRSIRDSYLNKK